MDRSRPIHVYGPTRAEAERNAAEYRERYPQDADRPMTLLVMWAGEPGRLSSRPIHVHESEAGTFVARDRDWGKTSLSRSLIDRLMRRVDALEAERKLMNFIREAR